MGKKLLNKIFNNSYLFCRRYSMSLSINGINQATASYKYQNGLMSNSSKTPLSPNLKASMSPKYLLLQGKLNNLQVELSREQTKLGILQNENLRSIKLEELEFEGKPLFNTTNEELIEIKYELIDSIIDKKLEIITEIKSILKEASNIEEDIELNLSPEIIEEIKKESSINLNSKKVERLLKDSSS